MTTLQLPLQAARLRSGLGLPSELLGLPNELVLLRLLEERVTGAEAAGVRAVLVLGLFDAAVRIGRTVGVAAGRGGIHGLPLRDGGRLAIASIMA